MAKPEQEFHRPAGVWTPGGGVVGGIWTHTLADDPAAGAVMLKSFRGIPARLAQRSRHSRTALRERPTRALISTVLTPAMANRMIWARRATCWAVPWARTSRSTSTRSSGVTSTVVGFGPAIGPSSALLGVSSPPSSLPPTATLLQPACTSSVVVAALRPLQLEASGFRPHRRGRRQWPGGDQWPGWLGRLEQRAHLSPALLKEAALLGQGDCLVEAGARAEVVTEFVMGRTEPGGGVKSAKSPRLPLPSSHYVALSSKLVF